MAAAHEPERPWRRRGFRHGVDGSDPRPARIDDEARLDADLTPPLVELDSIAVGQWGDPRHGAAVEDIGATRPRIEQDGKGQPRVVGRAVIITED